MPGSGMAIGMACGRCWWRALVGITWLESAAHPGPDRTAWRRGWRCCTGTVGIPWTRDPGRVPSTWWAGAGMEPPPTRC